MTQRFDVVVFGATSFVGQILSRTLLSLQQTVEPTLKWAIAGRSAPKLQALKNELGSAHLPTLIADASDPASLRAMCTQTKVVISTVGPYALYGSLLVEACAELGIDYCDITGEPHWVKQMIDRHSASAKKSGARIVHCCGFDSVPSDLGVHLLQREAHARYGKSLSEVRTRVAKMRGAASGGTVASMLNLMKEAANDPALRRELSNPYSLCPPNERQSAVRQPNANRLKKDHVFEAWVAPFVMAAINSRVVHRSNALTGYRYGEDFRYDEAMLMGRGTRGYLRALGLTGALGVGLAAVAFGPTRSLLEKNVLPKPGEGPSLEAQARGFFDFRSWGTTATGQTVRATVTGDRDPGYGSTAKMLAQAGLCLLRDLETAPGGFWTPAALMGDALIDRLVKHGGLTFDITA